MRYNPHGRPSARIYAAVAAQQPVGEALVHPSMKEWTLFQPFVRGAHCPVNHPSHDLHS